MGLLGSTEAAVIRPRRALAIAVLVAFSCSTALHGQTALSPDGQDKALAAVREYALNYAGSLPDYTCIRVTQQKSSLVIMKFALNPEFPGQHPDSTSSLTVDLKEELTVAGKQESYKVLTTETNFPRAVKPADEAFGTISVGEFNAVPGRVFAPETGASFRWARSGKLRGRPVLVFSFEVPAGHGARVHDNVRGRDLLEGYQGLIYADAESKAVLRVETHMSDFSSESEFRGIDLTLDYKAVKIGEREFALPYRFDLEWHRHKPGTLAKGRTLPQESSVTAEYQNYRVYTARSTVAFGPADSQNDVHSAITFGEIIPPDKR
jgi:hypothetical protein